MRPSRFSVPGSLRAAAATLAALLAATPPALAAGALTLGWSEITETKPVQGSVAARDLLPARARIGGTVSELAVAEGDRVEQGQVLARIVDDKIAFQITAHDARVEALSAQLAEAEAELGRGQALLERGVVTAQRLEQLQTSVDVIRNQIAATEAERAIARRQQEEGAVLAPVSGIVLSVPAARGAVLLPGEPVATVGGGGLFLRLAIPERFAWELHEDAPIRIRIAGDEVEGRLAKLYPQILGGRLQADVEVADLPQRFVGARLLVELPVGQRRALLVPEAALSLHAGVDFVTVEGPAGPLRRAVVPGARQDGMVEILSGLQPGDSVLLP